MSDIQTRMLRRERDPAKMPMIVRQLQREGMTRSEAMCEAYGFDPTDVGERETTSELHRIRIAGELFHVTDTRTIGYGDLVEIETEEGESFILSADSETAGAACKERWQDMAENEPGEFAMMVGEETLVSWALNRYAGPGSTKVRNLSEWLDLVADHPEEEWAGYDGEEREVDRVGKLVTDLVFTPTVAYRCN